MINLYRKTTMAKQQGAAMLFITVILLSISTLMIVFAANYSALMDKSNSNVNRNNQALVAAEAGMEYGINYLQQNAATILANPISGHIQAFTNSNVTNVALLNGSSFSITFSNPIANNYTLLEVTSTGRNDDGTTSRVITQRIAFGSLLATTPTRTVTARGLVSIAGNGEITNMSNPVAITSGSLVTITGGASTETAAGSNRPGSVVALDSTLQSMSLNDFVSSYFGNSNLTSLQGAMVNSYTNSTSTNYSSTLNGKAGTTIFINQTAGTATINGTTTIGTSSNPVLLVVNGNLSISGNVTVNGFVFVVGPSAVSTLTGNLTVNGGIASTSSIAVAGNVDLTYNPTLLNNLRNLSSMTYYAKVPGSWKDF